MAESAIKLSSPQEVREQVRRIAALLSLYEEDLREDAKEYASLGPMLEEAQQTLKHQRSDLQTALEQVRRQIAAASASAQSADTDANANAAEGSQAALAMERSLTVRLSVCEEKLREAGQCGGDYEGICQDMCAALQKSRQFSDAGKTLSMKMGQLLARIMELM